MSKVKLQHTVEVEYEGKKWKPSVVKVGVDECVVLNTHNGELVKLIANIMGIDVKMTDRPSLTHVPGFVAMMDLRNKAQAESLAPKNSLFDNDAAHLKSKRTRVEVKDLRSTPQLFEVKLDSTLSVMMQRPVKINDLMVVQVDDVNLENVFEFVKNVGASSEDFYTTRNYKTTGVKGVHKCKVGLYTYFYDRTSGVAQQRDTANTLALEDQADGDDDASCDVTELPPAIL